MFSEFRCIGEGCILSLICEMDDGSDLNLLIGCGRAERFIGPQFTPEEKKYVP